MAVTSLVFSQPSVAARPSRASIPSTSLPGYCRHSVAKPLRIGQRRRADHQPRQAEVEQLANRLLVANAAAQLALDVDRRQDVLHARQIDGQPLAGAFQIDDVQMLGAVLGELSGDGGRVLGEDGFLLVVALPQADAFSAAQIDRRPDLHRKSFRRRARLRQAIRGAQKHEICHTC